MSWRKVNQLFLPIKSAYFTLFAAIAALFPFIPVYMKQKGLTDQETAIIFGTLPFVSMFFRMGFCSLGDKFRIHRGLLIFVCVATAVIAPALLFIPNVNQCSNVTQDIIYGTPCNTEQILICLNEPKAHHDLTINCTFSESCTRHIHFNHEVHKGKDLNCSNSNSNEKVACAEDMQPTIISLSDDCLWNQNHLGNITCTQQVHALQDCKSSESNRTLVFVLVWSLSLLCYILLGPAITLVQGITYHNLGENRNKFGKQRYFGTIGFLLAALGMALLNQYTSDGSGQTNLTGNFICYTILCLLTGTAAYFFKMKGDIKCGGLMNDLGKVMRNPEAVAMLLFVLGMGINLGSHDAFLFLKVKSLGGSDMYLGLSLFMSCLIEIPTVFFADRYMGRLGYVNCLYISCIAYTVRLIGYGFMKAPWLVLVINLLHSVTFGFMFCSATAYGSLLTPPAMHATMQGLVQSAHFAIGRGLGAVIAGPIVQQVGISKMFFIYSAYSVVLLFIYIVTNWCLKKRKKAIKAKCQEEVKNGNISVACLETPTNKAEENNRGVNEEDTGAEEQLMPDVTAL